MFSTNAIVLKKTEIRNGEFLYHLLTRDFGKIRAWTNKRRKIAPIDHGTILHCTLSTKNSKNTIESVKITRVIRTEELGYASLTNTLSCLRHIATFLPEWVQSPTIFDDYSLSLPFFESEITNKRATTFFLLKMLKSCGVIGEHAVVTQKTELQKIVRHIDRYPLKTFHLIQGVSDDIILELDHHNERSIAPYLS